MRKAREVKYEWWVKLYKCSSCWEFLSKENFAKNIYWYDFISSECRKCSNERMKEYRKQNKEKLNAYQKSYKAKRMMMYEAHQSWVEYIPEPQYPQPWPQPIPTPQYPQPEPIKCTVVTSEKENDVILTPSINEWEPVITKDVPHVQSQSDWRADDSTSRTADNFTFSSKFARAEKLRQENLAAAEEEKKQLEDDEIVIQAAIDKNPDAYTEILSDEDLLNAFNNRSVESKINELTRRQQKFDKQKKEKEYNIKKEKMRDLVDATLDDKQKRYFEDKLHSLHEEQQDIFVDRMASLSKASFPVLREEIFDKLLENQTWKTSLSV